MDVNRLTQDLKFASQLGVTLNLEERLTYPIFLSIRVKVELGLLKLNEGNNFEQILFWGKIEGCHYDFSNVRN